MHIDDEPEVVQAHLGKALVAQDARVVHQDVDAPPVRKGCSTIADRVFVGHGRGDARHAADAAISGHRLQPLLVRHR